MTPKILWKRISVEDGDVRVCGPYRVETTWGVETGYTRKWKLMIDGTLHGVYDTRKAAMAAAQAHVSAGRGLWFKDWFTRHEGVQ